MIRKEEVRRVDLEIRNGGLAQFPEEIFSVPLFHGFSTVWAGNMSLKFASGEEEEEVVENRSRFLSFIGVSPETLVAMMPQPEHSDQVKIVGKVERGKTVDCDGLITSSQGIGLVLRPADCFPVIITGIAGEKNLLSLVHAGRVGTRLGIVPKAVGIMKDKGVGVDSFNVVIGPGIGPCCYNGTDLASEIVAQVRKAGVPENNIVLANCCTCCSKVDGDHLFFSRVRAKRDKREKKGRFMTFVALK